MTRLYKPAGPKRASPLAWRSVRALSKQRPAPVPLGQSRLNAPWLQQGWVALQGLGGVGPIWHPRVFDRGESPTCQIKALIWLAQKRRAMVESSHRYFPIKTDCSLIFGVACFPFEQCFFALLGNSALPGRPPKRLERLDDFRPKTAGFRCPL